jgi:NRAMP (natural resistance-associated macrophage protein)-like metal ion transporter
VGRATREWRAFVRHHREPVTPGRGKPSRPAAGVAPASKIGVREKSLSSKSGGVGRFLSILGPGIVVGASDDDPSGIATYSVAGASLGYSTLWTALVTYPMMTVVQFICAKIGLVSGKGLTSVLRDRFPRGFVYAIVLALAAANTLNAGADIGAIAAALNLLLPVKPIAIILPIGMAILAVQIWGSYKIVASIFKWLALTLLAYIGSAIFAHPQLREVLVGTFVPSVHFDAGYLATLVAILGTTISPYMFFWQATQEVEEDVALGRQYLWQREGTTDAEVRYMAWDINIGMLFSNVVMYAIILASAATLFKAGQHHIETAAQAAKALEPLAGKASSVLLALGLIGSGCLAVPVLTASSAYALSEAFGWKHGLSRRLGLAPQFYGVLILATLVGVEINLLGISAIAMLYWTAVINGLLAPVLLVFVMLVSNDSKVMGDRKNGPVVNAFGWLTTAAMALAAVALIVTSIHG